MRGFRALVLAAAAAALALPASADMIVKLKDGRTVVLPINPGDIESVTFGVAPPASAGVKPAIGGTRAARFQRPTGGGPAPRGRTRRCCRMTRCCRRR